MSYVFGDEAGRKVDNIKRAWETAVLKAHGHTLAWTPKGGLGDTSRAALDAIDLRFHLRHEGGSRLLEAGWPIHHVQRILDDCPTGQGNDETRSTALSLCPRRIDA